MEIRIAKDEDVKIIMKFELELFMKWDEIDPIDKIDKNWFGSKEHRNKIIKVISNPSKRIFLAFRNEVCSGYLKAEIIEREPFLKKVGYISEAYIVKNMRRKHIGSKLLNKALEWFKENDILYTTVSTHSKDIEAIDFWEKKDYVEYNKFFKRKI